VKQDLLPGRGRRVRTRKQQFGKHPKKNSPLPNRNRLIDK
jgi:hypothetical protein